MRRRVCADLSFHCAQNSTLASHGQLPGLYAVPLPTARLADATLVPTSFAVSLADRVSVKDIARTDRQHLSRWESRSDAISVLLLGKTSGA